MIFRRILSNAILLCVLFSAHLYSEVYHVSLNGSDSNDGLSLTNSMRTIQHAADRVSSGDSVIVHSGYYNERVSINLTASPSEEIAFIAEPRRTVQVGNGFDIQTVNIRIQGFELTNNLTSWPEKYAVFIAASGAVIEDNYFYDTREAAIRGDWSKMPSAVYIANNEVFHCQSGIIVEGQGWLVENNTISRLFDYGNGDCDYTRFFGNDHIIRGNTFSGTILEEVGEAHVDCFQTFDNSGQSINNIIIENNTCMDFMQGLIGEAHFYSASRDILIRNNIFAHGFSNNSHGIIIQDIPDVNIYNNLFYDIRWRGVAIQGKDNARATDATIINNIFSHCDGSYSFFDNTSNGDFNIVYQTVNHLHGGPNDLVGIDPGFSDPANNDFRPRIGSASIDAGNQVSVVLRDILGVVRPKGEAFDIGPYEFVPADTMAPSAPQGILIRP